MIRSQQQTISTQEETIKNYRERIDLQKKQLRQPAEDLMNSGQKRMRINGSGNSSAVNAFEKNRMTTGYVNKMERLLQGDIKKAKRAISDYYSTHPSFDKSNISNQSKLIKFLHSQGFDCDDDKIYDSSKAVVWSKSGIPTAHASSEREAREAREAREQREAKQSKEKQREEGFELNVEDVD